MHSIGLRPLIRDPRNLIGLIPAKGTRVIRPFDSFIRIFFIRLSVDTPCDLQTSIFLNIHPTGYSLHDIY